MFPDGRHPPPTARSSCGSTCPAPTGIDVTTDHGVLTVSAKRSQEYACNDPVAVELAAEFVHQEIRLAETVDTEKIEVANTTAC